MIELERHIEILLLSNDCVIVPELGGFMAHHLEARYDENDGLFLPPLRTLGFNPQLHMNDHLLVQSYIEAHDISYPEALRRIEEEVDELKQHIETEGEYELNDIGVLRLNDEGHYEFEPCEAGILTPDFYGLSTFEMQPLSKLQEKEEQAKKEEAKKNTKDTKDTGEETSRPINNKKKKTGEKAIVIQMSWARNLAAVAAAIIAFFIIGTPISNSDSKLTVQQSSIIPSVKAIDTNFQKAEATVAATEVVVAGEETATQPSQEAEEAKAEIKTVEEPQQPVVSNDFTIVLASQTTQALAENFMNEMKDKGFPDTHILRMNHTNKVRVVYGSFSNHDEAQDILRGLRKKSNAFSEAWILKTSN